MGTAIVLVVLIGTVAFVIRSMIKDKRAGKSLQCGGNCGACGGCGGSDAKKSSAKIQEIATNSSMEKRGNL